MPVGVHKAKDSALHLVLLIKLKIEPTLGVKCFNKFFVGIGHGCVVDIDIDASRKANDNRTIRKNLTLPSWLNDLAEKAGVNFSQILQEGLKEKLDVQNR